MFVQIVTFSTDDIDGVTALLLDYVASVTGLMTGLELYHDTDFPTRYFIIAGFESKATAELNNSLTMTHELDKKLRELCTGGPVYTNMERMGG